MITGQTLLNWRKENGISRERLSTLIGLSVTAITRFEKQQVQPQIATLRLIYRFLGQDYSVVMQSEHKKVCCRCRVEKSSLDFYRHRKDPDRLHHICKRCSIEQSKSVYRKRKDIILDRNKVQRQRDPSRKRHQRWKFKFGLSPDDYNKMLREQNYCCAACGYRPTSTDRVLGVDHDHETGQIRALLCNGCNLALGHLKEDAERCLRLATYIRTHCK